MLLYTLLGQVASFVPSLFSSFYTVSICIPWPPICASVELLSLGALYQLATTHASTSRWGHTLRAAILDLHLSKPFPYLASKPAILDCFLPVFPFPGVELDQYSRKPRTALEISAIKHTCLAVAGSFFPASQALETRSIRSASTSTPSPPRVSSWNLPYSVHSTQSPTSLRQKPRYCANPLRIWLQHLCLGYYLGLLVLYFIFLILFVHFAP